MASKTLRTIICGVPAGTLMQDESGLVSFVYDQDYDGPALSDSTVRAECSFVPKKMPTPSCIALANTAL